MAAWFVSMQFLFLLFLQVVNSSDGQGVISEIQNIRRLCTQQESLIETLRRKIQDQAQLLSSVNKKTDEQERIIHQAELINQAQKSRMAETQRFLNGLYQNEMSTRPSDTNFIEHISGPLQAPNIKRKRRDVKKPAFYASLNSTLFNLGSQQRILFDYIDSNVSTSYAPETGLYTVPSSGVYVFTWTTMNSPGTTMKSELVVNNAIQGMELSDAYGLEVYVSSSNTVVLGVQQHDQVSVQASYTEHYSGDLYGHHMTTFAGWKLF